MTTVEFDEDAKAQLEALQSELRRRTGRDVTQQELLARLIENAYESLETVVDSFRESAVPLSETEKERMRDGRISSGTDTDEEDIDESLYG
jgi:hypothetical protein